MKKYPAYKDSGIEWIGEIPEGWEVKRLKFVALVQPSNVDKKSYDHEIPVKTCNYIDVYNNEFITSKNIFLNVTANQSEINKFSLKIGDVLVTKDSETAEDIAVPALVNEKIENLLCGYHLTQIRANQIDLTSKYLFRLFQGDRFNKQFVVGANGVTRFGLSVYKFLNSVVPLPPLPEQKAIANFLDQKTSAIDILVDKKTRQIELLKEYRTAVINHAVTKGLDPDAKMKDSGIEWIGEIPEGWEVKKIRFLFKIRKRIIGEEGPPVLSITQRGIKLKDTTSGEGQLSMNYSKYQIANAGDFAMNHMDLLTGYVDISPYDGVISPDYRVFTLEDSESVPRYYIRLFQTCYHNRIFYAEGRGSSHLGRWRFPTENFKNFFLPYPPKNQQQAIANYLDHKTSEIDSAVERVTKQIELLKEYTELLL
jgi:type I restriction enzyme S subunit